MNASTKTILITGCSSGIGRATARRFQRAGWNVVATMRNPAQERELNLVHDTLVWEAPELQEGPTNMKKRIDIKREIERLDPKADCQRIAF